MGQATPSDVIDQSKFYAEQMVSQQTSELQKRLERIEQEENRRAEEQMRQKVYESLSGEYEDFDHERISQEEQRLNELVDLPRDEQLKEFTKLIYLSLKAQENTASLEHKFSEKSKKTPPISSKGAKKVVPDETGATLAEAEKLAAKEVEAML